MADDDIADPNDPDTLVVPFIFVPRGHPPPTEWLAAHPGWIRFPATMFPRDPTPGESGPQWSVQIDFPDEPGAVATTAATEPTATVGTGGTAGVRQVAEVRPAPAQGGLNFAEFARGLLGIGTAQAAGPEEEEIWRSTSDESAPSLTDQVGEAARHFLQNLNPISTAEAAGSDQRLGPDPNAIGEHSTFRRAPDGSIQHYETYERNDRTGGYDPVLRYRGAGKIHGDVDPPLVLERGAGKGAGSTPKVARPAMPSEIPGAGPPPSAPVPVPAPEPAAPDLPDIIVPEIFIP
jgi:hypothetical protein